MKNIIIYTLVVLAISCISLNVDAYFKDDKKCAEQQAQRTGGDHPGMAGGIGSTAASGLLAAPYGATAALSSMGMTAGFSLLTGAITNTDQKMFVNFHNRAAKAVKKDKASLPCKDIRTGEYEYRYGNCRESEKALRIVRADDLYSGLKQNKENSAMVETWEKIHNGANAFFITEGTESLPLIGFHDRTLIAYDRTGKNVRCAGQVKPGTHNGRIVLYCIDEDSRFCNKSYELKE